MLKKIFMKIYSTAFLLFAPILFFSFQEKKDNTLTTEEKKAGWKLLFDGKDMKGWRTYKNVSGSSWEVKKGSLCSEKPSGDKNPDLISNEMYENFELSIDWKITPKANSGIMYLVTEDNEHTYESGPEYQLIDDKGYPDKIEDWQKTAANYAMQAPSVDATKPPGEWNHTLIIVNKGHVEHWLNDKKVVEYEMHSDKWKTQKAAGKWKDVATYGAAKSGHIALQATHSGFANTGVYFKNVKIKLL